MKNKNQSHDRDSFLKAIGLNRKEVAVGKGQSVWVREMTASEVAEFVKLQKADKGVEAITHVIAATVCDSSGAKLLTAEDSAAVSQMGATVADAILSAALELSGLTTAKKA